MALQRIVEPTSEPVTVAEAKVHCRLDFGNVEPAPAALACALVSPPAAGNVDNGAHRYAVTFVTAEGETQAGTVSAAVTVADKSVNGRVLLTAIPTGGAAVTARKLYRTTAGGSTYLLLTTIADNATTSYSDNIADAALGSGAPSANTTGDPLLLRFIRTARETCESMTQRAIMPQTWRLSLDAFPSAYEGAQVVLPRARLITVDSVSYLDGDGVEQTLTEDTDYIVDAAHEPGRIVPVDAWPATQARPNAVTIEYTCGYASASVVPAAIKSWILAHVASLDSERTAREAVERGQVQANPYIDRLLDGVMVYA